MMRAVAFCLVLLVLCARELECKLPWDIWDDGEETLEAVEEGSLFPPPVPPVPGERREARWRRVAVSKTSREAVLHGLHWSLWQQAHSKSYDSPSEALSKYFTWRSNLEYIESHNRQANKHGFTLAMNSYGDMTAEEYAQNLKCIESPYYNQKGPLPRQQATPTAGGTMVLTTPLGRSLSVSLFNGSGISAESLPGHVDWRTQDAVTPVKDQDRCKSCYAFATNAAVEGMTALATGELVPLSEQNIIDCSIPYGNRGCSGGSRLSTVMYIVDSGGVDTADTYPYIGRQYLCKFNEENVGSKCTGVVQIQQGKEHDLQKAVAIVGPVTVAIDSRHSSFQFYSGGVYSEPGCSRTKLTHTLLVIGYGTIHGRDYWILKNSWGTSWGQNGFMMMTRNYFNHCGIASKAMFITI